MRKISKEVSDRTDKAGRYCRVGQMRKTDDPGNIRGHKPGKVPNQCPVHRTQGGKREERVTHIAVSITSRGVRNKSESKIR